MSNSNKLSETHTQHGGGKSINNKDAKRLDNKVRSICASLFQEIQKEYPNHKFPWESSIPKEEIAKKALGIDWKSYKPDSARSTGPKPDGGIIYVHGYNGRKYPVLIAEAKKQGTNKKRIKKGMKRQAKGNAIERAYKNVKEVEIFTNDLDYFPYVVVAHGDDFEKGSSINDRLDGLTKYHPRNKDYTLDKDQKTTVYVQEREFTRKEIYKRLKSCIMKCTDHVIAKEWALSE